MGISLPFVGLWRSQLVVVLVMNHLYLLIFILNLITFALFSFQRSIFSTLSRSWIVHSQNLEGIWGSLLMLSGLNRVGLHENILGGLNLRTMAIWKQVVYVLLLHSMGIKNILVLFILWRIYRKFTSKLLLRLLRMILTILLLLYILMSAEFFEEAWFICILRKVILFATITLLFGSFGLC